MEVCITVVLTGLRVKNEVGRAIRGIGASEGVRLIKSPCPLACEMRFSAKGIVGQEQLDRLLDRIRKLYGVQGVINC